MIVCQEMSTVAFLPIINNYKHTVKHALVFTSIKQ
jgi:hypothetical protein